MLCRHRVPTLTLPSQQDSPDPTSSSEDIARFRAMSDAEEAAASTELDDVLRSPALEATQGQIHGFFSQLPKKCHQNRVASVGGSLKICPWVTSRVDIQRNLNLSCAGGGSGSGGRKNTVLHQLNRISSLNL